MIHKILKRTDTRTPWEYLYDLSHSDRGPEHDERWMTERLQSRWPGPYRVEPRKEPEGWTNYHIVFDTPQEEMLFKMKWN